MKKTLCKYLCVLLAAVLLLPLQSAAAGAESAPGLVAAGYCGGEGDGTNLTWTLDDAGTLTISGTGSMYTADLASPWYSQGQLVNTVIVEDGVRNVGDYAFQDLANLTSVSLGGDVTNIGRGAFFYCVSLNRIEIPEGVISLDREVFSGCAALASVSLPASLSYVGRYALDTCTALRKIYYAGSEAQWGQINFEFVFPAEVRVYYNHYLPSDHTPAPSEPRNEVSATCTEPGSGDLVTYCTVCGEVLSSIPYTYPALGHGTKGFNVSTVPSTCAVRGYTMTVCIACGEVIEGEIYEIDPHNHAHVTEVPASEATENAHGYTAGMRCLDCCMWVSGHEVIHNHLGERTVVREPTETEEGLVDIVCTVCGRTIRYTAAWEAPEPGEDEGGDPGFWIRIETTLRGFIDWFLRLFRKPKP